MYFNQNYYPNPKMYGSSHVIKNYLNLDKDFLLPLTIPHGVNPTISANRDLIDLHNHEPIYVAFTKQIYEQTKKIKKTILFPHPWIFLTENLIEKKGAGTIFIGPANFRDNYKSLYNEIINYEKFEKPYAILVKKRDITEKVVNWWAKKSVKVETAGDVFDKNFYYNLLEIFLKYNFIATPYMSSSAIFAAAIKKKILVIPNLIIKDFEDHEITHLHELNSVKYNNIRNIWLNILSEDIEISSNQAKKLLGYDFLDNIENLRNKLINVINENKKTPLHLHPLQNKKNNFLYNLIIILSKYKIPIYKFFPNPLNKIYVKILTILKFNTLFIYEISDFGYFKITGKFEMPKFSILRSRPSIFNKKLQKNS